MIFIPHELVRNKEITDDEFLTYTFVQVLTYSANYDSCLFRVTDVVDQIYGEGTSHSIAEKTRKSLDKIIDKGLIDGMKQGNNYRIFMSSYKVRDDGFVQIDANDLRDIIDNTQKGYSEYVRFYCLVLSSIGGGKYGIKERAWFADIMGVTTRTISLYFENLEKLEKLYVYRAADFYTSNTYGLFEDKEEVRAAGKRRSLGREAHANANEKRKYITMYKNFMKGKEYPLDTLQEIVTYLDKRNKEVESLGGRSRGITYDLQPLIDKIMV